jgi:oligosaccharide repeat unit polymerase|tara:strand:- start:20723 stop:22096 length:1374 start_codon:yes stop_codon:yes gene_type:complete
MTISSDSLRGQRRSNAGAELFGWQQVESPLLLAMTVTTMAILVLFGGAPNVPGWRISLISLFSAALIVTALTSGSWAEFAKLGRLQKILLLCFLFLPLIQIIPLPPAIWHSLPGRETEYAIFALVGAENQWHSLSLDPTETLFVWTMLLPAAAVFLAILKLSSEEIRFISLSIMALALLSILIGLLQFSSNGDTFNFYDSAHKRFLLGFFANRNHQGLFIASALAFSINMIFRASSNKTLSLTLCGITTFFCIGAAIATTSRAGLSLTILAAIFSVLLNIWNGKKRWHIIVALAIICILFVSAFQSIGNVFENVVDRYSSVDDDSRWDVWSQSAEIILNYFPWGSGLGTFVPIYQKFEPLEMVMPTYINHVHNDYYELILETGLGGIAILALFATTLLQAFTRSPITQISGIKAASFVVILLILLHSVVDYPLRTQSMAGIFAFCLAVIFRPRKVPG